MDGSVASVICTDVPQKLHFSVISYLNVYSCDPISLPHNISRVSNIGVGESILNRMTQQANNTSEEQFTKTSLSDFVGTEKPQDEMEFTYDSEKGEIRVTIQFRNSQADAKIDSDLDFLDWKYRNVKTLPHKSNGVTVLSLSHSNHYHDGLSFDERLEVEPDELSDIGLDISDDRMEEFEQRLQEHKEGVEAWTQEAKKNAEQTELKFRVEEHDYKTGTWRTKYSHSEVILKPNKSKFVMTEEEELQYEAICEKLGTADDYPVAPDRYDEGAVLTVGELNVRDKVQSKIAEKQRQERKEEIVSEHGELFGVHFDVHEFEYAKRTAEQVGEKRQFAERSESCNIPCAECNLDIVTYYVNEDGDVVKTRSHTH